MRRKGTISFEFSVHLDMVGEADHIAIATVVDDWLALFTSDAPWRREYAQRTIFDTPDRDTFSVGFDTVLKDDAWEHWNAGLEKVCLEWLSNPLNQGRLETSVASEVNLITAALQTKGAVPEGNFVNALWRELSFSARQTIGMTASKDRVRSPERAQIREDLIRLLSGLAQDYRKRMDEHVRAYEWKHVVLIEQGTGFICAQGVDLSEAADQLPLSSETAYRLEPAARQTERAPIYHAFQVPECLHFDRGDAHLVERWGVYEGSYTVVEAKTA
ncbi:hypothetical protein [Microvirga sp. P5_D2]